MPRRRRTESVSNDSSPFNSASTSPFIASNAPLPTPTTLLSDIVLRSRLRPTPSRSSRSNSASILNSRNSSRNRRVQVDDVLESGVGNAQTGSSEIDGEARSERMSRGRRRAYSIRDEIDAEQESNILASPPSSSENMFPPDTPQPSQTRKPRAVRNKRGNKRRKLNNSRVTERQAGPSTITTATSSEPDVEVIHLPGEDIKSSAPPITTSEPLAEYACPICFSSPRNATLTPCGHVCCGECLFTAVRSTLQRAAVPLREPNVARCPVCRATINGWDGRGGGVIGLKPRSVISL